MPKPLLLLTCLFFLFSCYNPAAALKQKQTQQDLELKSKMDSWLGSHKSQLILSWGPPTRYASDGAGGEILIWEESRTIGATIYGVYQQRTITNYTEYYANKNGILHFWRTGNR